MANIIRQIVKDGEYGTQTIKMIVKANERGATGAQGPQGEAATISVGTTSTLPAGSAATVQNSGTSSAAVFNFGIPEGPKGDAGEAATVDVGTVTTLPAGNRVTVTNSGTTSAAILNFAIPQGIQGPKGDQGPAGPRGPKGDDAIKYEAGDYITITDRGVGRAEIAALVGDATLTMKRNNATIGTFKANSSTDKTINITVPTKASDVHALPDTVKYGASIVVSIDTTDYKITTTLKDQDGNTLGTAQVIDLPLESVVVNGAYDATNKKIILTLQNGNTIDIPVADLIAGLQAELIAGANIQIASDGRTISATDTTYTHFTGTDGLTDGTAGLVPAPTASDAGKYLKSDGTWAEVQGGGGGGDINVVQTTGTSTDDVMSQNATTNMIHPSNDKDRVQIGASASAAANSQSIAIGKNTVASNTTSVAIGTSASSQYAYSAAIGSYAVTSRVGEINVGTGANNYGYNSSQYRVIGGVYDPQTNHDAATKGYVDSAVTAAANAISSADWTALWA